MVKLVRDGSSSRNAARQMGVSLSHVQYWMRRTHGLRLDRVDWNDKLGGSRKAANRTSRLQEDSILETRKALCASALGEWGALAIHAQLTASHDELEPPVPCVRTIGRVLARSGLLDGRQRTRRAPPPRGWYLPLLAAGAAELDSFDIVEGLVIEGSIEVEVFNAMSLHGRLPGSWPQGRFTAQHVMSCLLDHWQIHGLPHYVQFDNAPCSRGPSPMPTPWAVSCACACNWESPLCLLLHARPASRPPSRATTHAGRPRYGSASNMRTWAR